MKNYLLFSLILLCSLCIFTPVVHGAGGIQYQTITNIPGVSQSVASGSIAEFFNFIVKWVIGIAAALAVLMIVKGGIKIMISDSVSGHSDGKENIQSAIWGILIALCSWLLLSTIDPRLVNLEFKVDPVKVTAPGNIGSAGTPDILAVPGGTAGGGGGATGTPASGQLTPIPAGINVKPGTGTQVDSSLAPKLSQLNTNLTAEGINWHVTEASNLTYTNADGSSAHVAGCHKDASCIDANFTGSTQPTVQNINAFIKSASNAGLRAEYEVSTQAEATRLTNAGVVKVTVARVTAPHFSVYNN